MMRGDLWTCRHYHHVATCPPLPGCKSPRAAAQLSGVETTMKHQASWDGTQWFYAKTLSYYILKYFLICLNYFPPEQMYKPCFPFNNGTSDILCSIYSENRKQLQNNSKQSQTNLPLIGHRTRFLKPIGKEFKINGKLIWTQCENSLKIYAQ